MPPYTGEGTYITIFVETRKYEVRVKAPSRQAAESWADANNNDIFKRVATHTLGKVLRDGHDIEFECQDVIKTIAAEEDEYDLTLDEAGREIHGKTR